LLPQPPNRRGWHALESGQALAELDTPLDGLSPAEAKKRLASFGPNRLPEQKRRSALLRFLAQFHNTLIYVLMVAAVAAALLNHLTDALVILAVIVLNAIIGFVQEGRAERALDALRELIAPRASVLRDGRREAVPVETIVTGDLVIIEAGDRVPADLRLVEARRLTVDEALLTGESVASEKDEARVPAGAPLGDRRNMAFSGAMVLAGQARGVVVATGATTEIGRISGLLESVDPLTTPLLRQIEHFARRFTWLVLGGALFLFLFAVFARGYEWVDALIAVVALGVGIVPEGLPAVITITLAIGVRRMAARRAVIRKLPAVETLGATSVICTDKTGTLTRNEMTARRVMTAGTELAATGAGYAPVGELRPVYGSPDDAEVPKILLCGLLCNDASLRQQDDRWDLAGDPMEGALLALAGKAGIDPAAVRADHPRLDAVPFDAEYRFMATLHRSGEEVAAYVKGAPEALFAMAGPNLDVESWNRRIAAAAAEGERLLAFGRKRFALSKTRIELADLTTGVELLGLVSFIDPPRPEAIDAIQECRSAGISVKMITGDHAATALAIGRQIRLADELKVVTGAELDGLSGDELHGVVRSTSVFARTSPENKLTIVRSLQEQGLTVAMTGDGVNDAPSLKQADVGVAMGIKGTEVSKEAADMVLLDDNFASIVAAVREGRTVYDNIRKVISWELPTNGGETLAVALAILLGFSLPMTATQILWSNLLMAGTLGLALAFEPAEPRLMQRPPRAKAAPLLSPFLVWRIAIVSLLLTAAALGIFFYALGAGRSIETARTMVVNVLVVCELFYLFNVRYLHTTSITFRGALGTPAVLIAVALLTAAQLLFTYAPFMNRIFGSRPLSLQDGLLILAIAGSMMLLLEGEKLLMRKFGWLEREVRRSPDIAS
jgi:magnesium-transporting ATPase (P-type)